MENKHHDVCFKKDYWSTWNHVFILGTPQILLALRISMCLPEALFPLTLFLVYLHCINKRNKRAQIILKCITEPWQPSLLKGNHKHMLHLGKFKRLLHCCYPWVSWCGILYICVYHLQFNNTEYLMSLWIVDKHLTQFCKNMHALNNCHCQRKWPDLGIWLFQFKIQIASVK